MSWMFFLFGLGSLTGQILLLREILIVFHGTEICIGIFYAAWLAGIGIGASVGAWLVRKHQAEFHGIFLHCLVALALSLLFQILLIRAVPSLFGLAAAELAPLRGILVAVPLGNFLTAFLTGFLFPVGCSSVRGADDRLIARVYVLEAFGSLAGGLVFTFVLVRLLSPLRIAAVLALLLAAGALIYSQRLARRDSLFTSLAAIICALVVMSPLGERIVKWSEGYRWQALHPGLKLLDSHPTPYQQVEIASLGKQYSLFGNGKIVSSFPDSHTADRMAALIVAQNPSAKNVLLIGGGIGSLPRSVLKYPVDRIDILEPDPWAFEIARKYLPREESLAVNDPRVRLIFEDGRFHMNRIEKANYDVIVAMTPDPVSSFWNRYYTLEFFQAVRRALAPDGVFCTRVTSAENFWGSEVASYAGSVFHTLKEVFSAVEGTPGDETIFFASPSTAVPCLKPDMIRERYRRFGGGIFDPAGFDTLLPPERTAFVRSELERSPFVINTDLAPISSSLALVLWGRFSGTERMELLETIRRGGVKVYLIPILFFIVARISLRAARGPAVTEEGRFHAVIAMAAAGATAMGLQIVLIYAYQSLFGYVFERIGLFAAVFMIGLVAGGFGAGQALRAIRNKTLGAAVLLGLMAVICLATPWGIRLMERAEPGIVESAVFAMVFLSGAITGAVFPLSASWHLELTGNPGQSSGWIDAADHYGAAVGALITGTLLFPLIGLDKACLVLAVVATVPILLVGVELLFSRVEPLMGKLRLVGGLSFPFVRMSTALVVVVAGSFTWNLLIGPPKRPMTVLFQQEVLEKVSGSTSFTFAERPFPYYLGESGTEVGRTFSLSTFPIAGNVRGYGGPINLLVSVSDKGTIKGVQIVESRETPSYLVGMDRWLERFQGQSIFKPLSGEVDALTGATITCRAVTEILERTGQRMAEPLLGIAATPDAAGPASVWASGLRDVRLWVIVGLILFFVIAFHSRSRGLRLVCLAVSLMATGFYLNAPFTCLDAARLLHGEIPAIGTLWRAALFVGILLISVFWGQAFCGFLCPFGALQELISFRALRRRASVELERYGRFLKFVLLAILLSLFLLTDEDVWFSFSPLQHFFSGKMDYWVAALCGVVLVASLFYFRFWCRYLCPAGAFLALFNKMRILKRWAPRNAPARCDLGVSHKNDVDCIRCHRCIFEDHIKGTEVP